RFKVDFEADFIGAQLSAVAEGLFLGGLFPSAVKTARTCIRCPPRPVNRRRAPGLALGHGQLPVIESRTVEAYFAGSSSQTKCPASMTTRRLVGSHWWRNSALGSGTTRSLRPLMIVTGTVICGSSPASTGSSSGYLRT